MIWGEISRGREVKVERCGRMLSKKLDSAYMIDFLKVDLHESFI